MTYPEEAVWKYWLEMIKDPEFQTYNVINSFLSRWSLRYGNKTFSLKWWMLATSQTNTSLNCFSWSQTHVSLKFQALNPQTTLDFKELISP